MSAEAAAMNFETKSENKLSFFSVGHRAVHPEAGVREWCAALAPCNPRAVQRSAQGAGSGVEEVAAGGRGVLLASAQPLLSCLEGATR
jgi:hypothetical protein